MAALTKDRNTTRKATGQIAVYPVAQKVKIFAGSLVCLDATGYAVPASDAAGLKFIGVSRVYVDNTGGANGAASVEVMRDGIFDYAAADMGIDDVGKPVFIVDDQTVALTSTNNVGCGIISEVESATKVWVDIAPANRKEVIPLRVMATQAVVASENAADAAAEAPTKAEYDALVALANENKAVINGLIAKLKAAEFME